MSVFQSAWYLIYTRIRCERKVVNELKKRDIEFYWPTCQSLREWRSRRKLIELPLFPSYVFVHLKSMEDYYVGLKIEGTMFYVKSGKEVVVVDEKIINNLKRVVNNVEDIEVTTESFRPSQKVVIKEGPLCGMTCEVVQYQKKERILVRLNMLNRNVLIGIPENQLMTADANNQYSLVN
jgi:transcriptional antiterminator RfaH